MPAEPLLVVPFMLDSVVLRRMVFFKFLLEISRDQRRDCVGFVMMNLEKEEVEIEFRAGHMEIARQALLVPIGAFLYLITDDPLLRHRWAAADAVLSILSLTCSFQEIYGWDKAR